MSDDMEVVDLNTVDLREQEVPATPQIPDKFRNKSPEELVEMYRNLESTVGRQSNELGELRKLRDQLMIQQYQTTPTSQPQQEQEEDIDWWGDPEKAINKTLDKKLQKFESFIANQQLESTRARVQQAHPDYAEIASSEDFAKWVMEDPVRQQLYRQADRGDSFETANYILTEYKKTKQTANQSSTPNVANAIGETGSAPRMPTRKVYRRTDIQALLERDPARYNQLLPEIKQAYLDGRVI